MRIISGKFKGKKILEPNDLNTRPLKDLTKESIFNIIKHSNKFTINLENSEILDLFSGTGSFGIECISRGAKFVTFVENYDGILPILKKNLANLKSVSNYFISEKNIFNNLNLKELKKQFDIIFLDPPYKEKELNELLSFLINEKILKQNGIIIIHRHKKQIDSLPNQINILEEKKYGISKILFCNIS
ncbi:16S rRNA (guanine(966)-N(2))-methyltransferase RsmD [Candidatus Pelagibacter sp. HIMB1709]|uniref:16S rRNA (guanine(966)-N(2))-methyltransferase RsmD n=1 Tax=Candidatus Pelagibacter sp. HIMB1709 TaxID=3413367 RepID=UPI003F84F75C